MKANEKTPLFSKVGNLVFLIAAISLLTLQCKCKQPLVKIKSHVKAIHGIEFIDVNTAVDKNVHNVKVTLIDPGKMVLSSNGILFESVELSEGVMSIGLSPEAVFNLDRPYRFSIRAEAKGYMTTIRSIVITDSTSDYVPIYMARLDSLPPSGMAASTGNITAVSGGVITQDQVLTAEFANKKVAPLVIKISDSTQLFYDDKPIKSNDELSFRLLFGIPRDTNANRAFPGGFEVTDAIDQTGKKIAGANNPIFFRTAGWFSMEMNVGKIAVNRFSKPLDVEIPIGDTVINPVTNQPVKIGDTIPLWSLDNRTGTWRIESNAQILASTNGGMKANIRINHLSTFNLDFWTGTTCTIKVHFNAIPPNAINDFPGTFYTEYVSTADNSIIRGKQVDYTLITTGTSPSPLEVLRVPTAYTPGKLYVHNGLDASSPLRGMSSDLSCGECGTISQACLGTLGSLNFPSVTIRFVKESGPTITNNNVWQKPMISIPEPGGWIHVGVLPSPTGELVVPEYPGVLQQNFQLWYYNATTMMEASLIFELPNVTASGSGTVTSGAITMSFDYTVVVPGPGTSQRLITITVPSSLFP